MKRIDSKGATKNGLFTEGDRHTAATTLSAEWCNDVQEELINAIESIGTPLLGKERNELAQTLNHLKKYGASFPSTNMGNTSTHVLIQELELNPREHAACTFLIHFERYDDSTNQTELHEVILISAFKENDGLKRGWIIEHKPLTKNKHTIQFGMTDKDELYFQADKLKGKPHEATYRIGHIRYIKR